MIFARVERERKKEREREREREREKETGKGHIHPTICHSPTFGWQHKIVAAYLHIKVRTKQKKEPAAEFNTGPAFKVQMQGTN